jgi:hypothetical protein
MAVDATGVVHLVSTTGGGNYYFSWQDGRWSPPVLISPGLDGRGVTGSNSSLEQPAVAISEGNRLHAAFHDGFERIWYTMRRLGAPHQAPHPLPTLAPTPSPAPPATPTSLAEAATAPPTAAAPAVPPDVQPSPQPLWVGALSAAAIVGVTVAVRRASRRGRR